MRYRHEGHRDALAHLGLKTAATLKELSGAGARIPGVHTAAPGDPAWPHVNYGGGGLMSQGNIYTHPQGMSGFYSELRNARGDAGLHPSVIQVASDARHPQLGPAYKADTVLHEHAERRAVKRESARMRRGGRPDIGVNGHANVGIMLNDHNRTTALSGPGAPRMQSSLRNYANRHPQADAPVLERLYKEIYGRDMSYGAGAKFSPAHRKDFARRVNLMSVKKPDLLTDITKPVGQQFWQKPSTPPPATVRAPSPPPSPPVTTPPTPLGNLMNRAGQGIRQFGSSVMSGVRRAAPYIGRFFRR